MTPGRATWCSPRPARPCSSAGRTAGSGCRSWTSVTACSNATSIRALPRDSPEAWRIEPDPGRIAAVLDGYARWRRLDDAERAALAEGIRFAAAYVGAIHFEQALIGGVHGPAMDARLGRLRNRIAVSQAVADLAARHLGAR